MLLLLLLEVLTDLQGQQWEGRGLGCGAVFGEAADACTAAWGRDASAVGLAVVAVVCVCVVHFVHVCHSVWLGILT